MQVYSLLLLGGCSRRMGRDKTTLSYREDGRSQALCAYGLLKQISDYVYLSVRPGQLLEQGLQHISERIEDCVDDPSPVDCICAAFERNPRVSWLVLACDMPWVDISVLQCLVNAHRDLASPITAFRNSQKDQPEPLCAIYRAEAFQILKTARDNGMHSPKQIIIENAIPLIDLNQRFALENVNTPEDYQRIRNAMMEIQMKKKIQVLYFAGLRVQAGISSEMIETELLNVGDFYAERQKCHGISMPRAQIRVAINEEFAEFNAPLVDGDTIAFLPPVSGG